jgi:hypothetical protein
MTASIFVQNGTGTQAALLSFSPTRSALSASRLKPKTQPLLAFLRVEEFRAIVFHAVHERNHARSSRLRLAVPLNCIA